VPLQHRPFRPAFVLTLPTILASALLLGAFAFSGRATHPGGRASADADTLVMPPVMKNVSSVPGTVEVNLVAAPARLALLPGHVTNAFAYNGSVPGPTL